MKKSVGVAWDHGYIHLEANDVLTVKAENVTIEFASREIRIRGLFAGVKEFKLDKRGQRKIVYIVLAFNIAPLSGTPKSIILDKADFALGRFGVSYTIIDGIERYITVYTPADFLYDHAVVSSDRIAVTTLGRRQVYLMEEGEAKKLILV